MLYGSVLEIHAYAMGAALLLFVASELLLIPARQGRRETARIAFLASRLGNLFVGIGLLAGIVLVYVGGWSLLTPWLVASFALIAALVTVGRKFVRPWETLARSVLRGTASGKEVETFASEKRALFGRVTVIALFALVAALMVTKPDLGLLFS